MFDKLMGTNSTMVGEKFQKFKLEIPRNAIKTHGIFMFHKFMGSNYTMVGEINENLSLKSLKMQ